MRFTLKPNERAFCLTYARRDIPQGEFGYVGRWFCDRCKGIDEEPEYHRTFRGTYWQPEEGIEVCPHCGSQDVGENDAPHRMKATKRLRICKQRTINPAPMRFCPLPDDNAMPWRNDAPPNEKFVEVMHEGKPIQVMAFYGRDGYRPHWRDDKGCCWSVGTFTEWRELQPESIQA